MSDEIFSCKRDWRQRDRGHSAICSCAGNPGTGKTVPAFRHRVMQAKCFLFHSAARICSRCAHHSCQLPAALLQTQQSELPRRKLFGIPSLASSQGPWKPFLKGWCQAHCMAACTPGIQAWRVSRRRCDEWRVRRWAADAAAAQHACRRGAGAKARIKRGLLPA